MNQQSTAVATAPPKQEVLRGEKGHAQDLTVIGIEKALEKPGLERVETVVIIPPDFQYAITKWMYPDKVPEGAIIVGRGDSMVEIIDRVGLTIDAYDYINRVLGASFFLPELVHDEYNEVKRNPIHRQDYIYLRQAAVWYSPLGQMLYSSEDVEVNFKLAYMEARVTSKSAEPILDENGNIQWDEAGQPLLKLNPKDEMKALKQFATQRNFGPRYAQSVARVRLLKQATGIRSLPISEPQSFPLKVVGYRDQLTAQQRIQQISTDAAPLFGRPDDIQPLSSQQMAEAGIEDKDTELDADREAVEAAQAAEAEAAAPQQQAEPMRAVRPATPEEVQQEGLGLEDGLPTPR